MQIREFSSGAIVKDNEVTSRISWKWKSIIQWRGIDYVQCERKNRRKKETKTRFMKARNTEYRDRWRE